jgi:hypothetical protein
MDGFQLGTLTDQGPESARVPHEPRRRGRWSGSQVGVEIGVDGPPPVVDGPSGARRRSRAVIGARRCSLASCWQAASQAAVLSARMHGPRAALAAGRVLHGARHKDRRFPSPSTPDGISRLRITAVHTT